MALVELGVSIKHEIIHPCEELFPHDVILLKVAPEGGILRGEANDRTKIVACLVGKATYGETGSRTRGFLHNGVGDGSAMPC